MAMVVSAWISLYQDMNHLSLKSLELKMRGHWERPGVVSFYGAKNTLCFQARRQGDHRLLRFAIHHLHLDLRRRVSERRPLVHLRRVSRRLPLIHLRRVSRRAGGGLG